MQKLNNIVLKKGDIVSYYSDEYDDKFEMVISSDINTIDRFQEILGCKITKIQRPIKYETIYEAPNLILDKKEKEYLEAVIRPFKNRIRCIEKTTNDDGFMEFIRICLGDECMYLPDFKKGTMYKGLELFKEYTLEELGLFEE